MLVGVCAAHVTASLCGSHVRNDVHFLHMLPWSSRVPIALLLRLTTRPVLGELGQTHFLCFFQAQGLVLGFGHLTANWSLIFICFGVDLGHAADRSLLRVDR